MIPLKKWLVTAFALVFAFAGCAPFNGNVSTDGPRQAVNTENSLPSQDRAGNPFTLAGPVETVISMAPSTTQVLLDLGVGSALLAVDTNSRSMLEDTAGLPAFDMMAPDTEQLLALRPDLVFVSDLSAIGGEDPFAQLAQLGIVVAVIPTSDTLDGIKADVLFIAACLGLEAQGEALIEDLDTLITQVSGLAQGIPAGDRKSVLFEVSALPYIYSFGQGVYLHEILELIGADNALAGQSGWISVTEEAALAANPDVILSNVNYLEDSVGEILSRAGWESVTAVANGQVYYIDNDASSLPNHHVAQAIREIAQAVYPHVYGSL